MADTLTLEEVQAAITERQARWEARETSLSILSPEVRQLRAGYIPLEVIEMSLEEREKVAEAHKQSDLDPDNNPSVFDLRNVGGIDFTSTVKNQRDCMSCVAFGTAAAVEATTRFQRNQLGLIPDFSEAQIFFCYGNEVPINCQTGWAVTPVLDVFKDRGVVPENLFRYNLNNQICPANVDWNNDLTKIRNWHRIDDWQEMRRWISTQGALVTVMTAYPDLTAYYGSGIYTQVLGSPDGGHCVSCIGYDHQQRYWICQNSVGTAWGESGYFRIAYGEVGIDAAMWAVIP
jgi:C1A family cysteine protease